MKTLLAFLSKTMLIGAAGVLAACGSNVTNNGTGGAGGAGGAGGSGGAGAGPTGEQACVDFCHKMEVNNCGVPGDCTQFCDGLFADVPAECVDKLGAVYACGLPHVGASCPSDAPPECVDEEQAAETCLETYGCIEGECSEGVGMNGDTSCGCMATCQSKDYETDCATPSGGMTTCKCLVGGVEVGTCTNADSGMCGVQEGCCNTEYFKIP